MTNPNTVERLIDDQIFKITKSDDQIRHFLDDCIGNTNHNAITKRPRY